MAKKYNLNDLVPEKELKKAKTAGLNMKRQQFDIEKRCKTDPDFDKWYEEECRKNKKWWKEHTNDLTMAELNEKYKHCRGL